MDFALSILWVAVCHGLVGKEKIGSRLLTVSLVYA